jgi:hypothetical protein
VTTIMARSSAIKWLPIALLFFSVGTSSPAGAAAVKQNVIACHAEIDAKRREQLERVRDKQPTAAYGSTKTGECSSLPKGMTVAIEQVDGQLACVRPWGGLDCFWAPIAAIDQNAQTAPSSERRTASRTHGFRRSFVTPF